MDKLNRRNFIKGTAMAALLTACTKPSPQVIEVVKEVVKEVPKAAKKLVKAAFVLLWECADNGWTAAHCLGIQEVRLLGKVIAETANSFDLALPGERTLHVVWVEKAGDGPDSGRIIEQFAADGYDIVFATTFGQMDFALQTALAHPQVAVEHCSGYKTSPNMNWYFGRMEQIEYVLGYLAGLLGYHRVGTVATNPICEPIRGINGFTLGLQRGLTETEHKDWAMAPDLNTVVWLNAWRDFEGETVNAERFAKQGYDLVRQMADTPDSAIAACKAGTPAVGYGMDVSQFGATCAIGSSTWLWGPYYRRQIKAILDGNWQGNQTYFGGLGAIPEPLIGLVVNPSLPKDAIAKAKALAYDITQREREATIRGLDVAGHDGVFSGPIYDQAGKIVVAEGKALNDVHLLEEMRWFVRGVKGEIPA